MNRSERRRERSGVDLVDLELDDYFEHLADAEPAYVFLIFPCGCSFTVPFSIEPAA